MHTGTDYVKPKSALTDYVNQHKEKDTLLARTLKN